MATPVATVKHTSHARDIETILAAAAERQAERIVVGMPLSLSGDMGPQARKVARFVEKLAARDGHTRSRPSTSATQRRRRGG